MRSANAPGRTRHLASGLRRQRQCLAAGASREIDDLFAGLGAGQQRSELRALVLDFDRALEKGGLRVNSGIFRIRRKPKPQTDRRPSRRLGVEMRELGRNLFALRLERIDAQVERRPARKRRAFRRVMLAEDSEKIRIEPLGIVPQNMRRCAAERIARQSRAFGFRQRRGRELCSAAQGRNVVDAEAALTMQHADEHGARAAFAHEPGRRRFAPHRVVHQTGNRGAVGRAGETMRKTPVLERVRSRPSPRVDVGDDLDGSRKASGRRHAVSPRPAKFISFSFHCPLQREAAVPEIGKGHDHTITPVSISMM